MGDVKVSAPINKEDFITNTLWCIVFQIHIQRDIIYDNSINYFSDTRMLMKNKYLIYQLTLAEGLRLPGGSNLGCKVLGGLKNHFVGSKFFPASQNTLSLFI